MQGRLKVRTETREGQQGWTSADIDAVAIGHDLARGTSAFRRSGRPEPAAAGTPTGPNPLGDTGRGFRGTGVRHPASRSGGGDVIRGPTRHGVIHCVQTGR